MYGTVVASRGLNVRQNNSLDSDVIGFLKDGDRISICEDSDPDWFRIYIDGHGGSVYKQYVKVFNFAEIVGISSSLHVRKTPNGEIIGKLYDGIIATTVESECTDEWLAIQYCGGTAFISRNYIEIVAFGEVTTDVLNVRSKPTTESNVIGQLNSKDVVKIICAGNRPGWYMIDYKGLRGYVDALYLGKISIDNDSINEKIMKEDSAKETCPNYSGNLVSDQLVDFVKSYEGFYSKPYFDCVGVRTIGYGSTSGWIMNKTSVTKEEATKALMEEITSMAKRIRCDLDSKGIQLKQHEFDALASFAYNCGVQGLLGSTLYRRICAGVRDSSLKENFVAWSHGDGKVILGLKYRRIEEYDMFIKGDYRRDL